MIVNKNGFIVTISNDSEIASKIKEGYDYTVDDHGSIILKEIGNGINTKWQIIEIIKKVKNIEELKVILIKMLENNL